MAIPVITSQLSHLLREELARIDRLTDYEVFVELQKIMEGRDYSWHAINQGLQAQVDDGVLTDEVLIARWNFLCEEKRRREHMNCRPFERLRYNRGCLFSLNTIPTLAGLSKSYA
jgi:hypothetical protein